MAISAARLFAMGTNLRVEESKGRAGANQDSKQSLDGVLVLPEPAALTDSTATSASFKEFTRKTAYSGELQWSLYFRERTSCLIASQRHHLRASARRVTHVTIVFCDQLLTFLRYIFGHNH